MDPREALDITIKLFGLKAADIARASGVTVQMLSRYRKKRQDMNSLNAFQVIRALPEQARQLFWYFLLIEGEFAALGEKLDSEKTASERYDILVSAIKPELTSTEELSSSLQRIVREFYAASSASLISTENSNLTSIYDKDPLTVGEPPNLDHYIPHTFIDSPEVEQAVLKYLQKYANLIIREELEKLSLDYPDTSTKTSD